MMPPPHVSFAAAASSTNFFRRRASILLLICLALLSHYLLDMIPHPEPSLRSDASTYLILGTSDWWWALRENIAAALIVLLAPLRYSSLRHRRFYLFTAAAWCPDFIQPVSYWLHSPTFDKLSAIHSSSHVWRGALGINGYTPASVQVWALCWSLYLIALAGPFVFLELSRRRSEQAYQVVSPQLI